MEKVCTIEKYSKLIAVLFFCFFFQRNTTLTSLLVVTLARYYKKRGKNIVSPLEIRNLKVYLQISCTAIMRELKSFY